MKEEFLAGLGTMFVISVVVVFFLFGGGNPKSLTRRVMDLEKTLNTKIAEGENEVMEFQNNINDSMLKDMEKLRQGRVTCGR